MSRKVFISGLIILSLLGFIFYQSEFKSSKEEVTIQKISPSVGVPLPYSSPGQNQLVEYSCQTGLTPFKILSERYKIEYEKQDLGPLVISINEQKPNGNEYWAFYIDGKMAPVGADNYQCQRDEKIEWKLEKF